jgi:glycosidase
MTNISAMAALAAALTAVGVCCVFAAGCSAPDQASAGTRGADSGRSETGAGEAGPVPGDAAAPPPDADAGTTADGGSVPPIDLAATTIYCVYVPIFSTAGNLAAVTTQLPRIRALGLDVVYLLPVTPIGKPIGTHPSYNSPYSVHDYYAIDPAIGSSQDLVNLVDSAHHLGMHVILDEVLNHTSWDNALITQHPEYYLHSDGNRNNPASIEIAASTFADSAQLDYKTMPDLGLRQYVTDMLLAMVRTYDVDGFRFDTADDPFGAGRLIPADFWQGLRPQLEAAKPGLLMLGEEEDPALADAPFELDYGWILQGKYGPGGLRQVATGASASLLQQAWQGQQTGWPAAMKHMTLLQDWDFDEDLKLYGGVANTLAAATFNFTIDGVPLLFNGEEVGNDNSAFNTHAPIDWTGPNASAFTPFYESLLALRNGSSALQQGAVTWIANSAPAHVVSYTRSDASATYLVVINFSGAAVAGTVSAPAASGWLDVSPVGAPGGDAHAIPPALSLKAFDFAVFQQR